MKAKNILLIPVFIIIIASCNKKKVLRDVDFRKEMISFVSEISEYSKAQNPNFLIFPQNGEALLDDNAFIDCIDGIGKEDLSYGYEKDGESTGSSERSEMAAYLDKAVQKGKCVLVTDYVFSDSEDVPHFDASTKTKINNAYSFSSGKGYIPYATVRNLNYLTINPGHEPSEDTINELSDVKEFLYYLQPNENISKAAYITSLAQSDYDLVIMDFSYDGLLEFTYDEIQQIKTGLNNGKGGIVLAYMSIGEAEDYRYYWNEDWTRSGGGIKNDAPDWLYKENPDWKGNYKVLYWKPEWKEIIFGTPNSYLDKIISKGFDGVYLDIIDGFEYFEDIMD